LLLHVASENKLVGHVVKGISAPRPACATAAWNIMCKRLDGRSFARSLSLLDNLILRQRLGKSHTKYVHFMR
jgi:hypothetical protein